ncbi:hypothetical protein HDF12_002310 [Edaphobacter lichenicola]|uniref:Uncharacterized protein n=1 Tax=Tunturiibacter lichenicola TaxID=2051959 RepID=A0A7Y9TA42_9BACT|nr:hypothetical protein [Edaphobacter lichenicola]
MPFPTPEISLTDQDGFPHNVISAAQLPTGLLQVFYLGVSGTVHTSWQQSSQNPQLVDVLAKLLMSNFRANVAFPGDRQSLSEPIGS